MSIRVLISTVADSSMFIPDDRSNKMIAKNRKVFLEKNNIAVDQSTRVNITYNTDTFLRYRQVSLGNNSGEGMVLDDSLPADALITQDIGHALFLPLADCVGAVLYDPVRNILMLSHLGRHSTEQFGGTKCVEYLKTHYNSNPNDILVWLTPSPGKDNYPMWAFDNRSIKDVVTEQLLAGGVQKHHITDNTADTTKDIRYFSHSEYLAGRRSEDGRYAVVAIMD